MTAFYKWLVEHRDENTAIGDLASDVHSDPEFPKDVASRDVLISYLERRGACYEAIGTAHTAWTAWSGEEDPDEDLLD